MTMLSSYSKLLMKGVVASAALMLTQVAVAAGDAERGEMLADTCMGCHGVDTYNNVYPTYHVPKVVGQNAGYLADALTQYRAGQRSHRTMKAQAASLSDQDIQDIAAYFATAGGIKDAAAIGTAPEKAAVCAACHGQSGISPIPTNPNLAGQYKNYLQEAAAQYQRGERKAPMGIAMQAQLSTLSDEDIAAIAAYYAAQKGLDSL